MKSTTLLGILFLCATNAWGWEAETTHVGITEQAAIASELHDVLASDFGRALGLYEPLTLPSAVADTVSAAIAKLAPSDGLSPDSRGRQSALSWLLAGAAIEDIPAERGRNHFFDPVHKTGLTGKTRRGIAALFLQKVWGQKKPPSSGIAAPAWVTSDKNEHSVQAFWRDLEAAVASEKPAERDARLALALVHAGALAHVLADMGAPSRVRDDLAEHLSRLGGGDDDRGSRFEHLAALTYGRLAVPAPTATVKRAALAEFFTSGDGQGLADVTAKHWYSSGTLPAQVDADDLRRRGSPGVIVAATQRYVLPTMPTTLDLDAAQSPEGAVLADSAGVCLARYHISDEKLEWAIPDSCAAEQMAVILPTVGAYSAGLLDWLFRGRLKVEVAGETATVSVKGVALGKGTLRLFAEDAAGTRKQVGEAYPIGKADAQLGSFPVPADAHLVALFTGVDAVGEQVVAVGQSAAAKK